jgi:hypothetical protein
LGWAAEANSVNDLGSSIYFNLNERESPAEEEGQETDKHMYETKGQHKQLIMVWWG